LADAGVSPAIGGIFKKLKTTAILSLQSPSIINPVNHNSKIKKPIISLLPPGKQLSTFTFLSDWQPKKNEGKFYPHLLNESKISIFLPVC